MHFSPAGERAGSWYNPKHLTDSERMESSSSRIRHSPEVISEAAILILGMVGPGTRVLIPGGSDVVGKKHRSSVTPHLPGVLIVESVAVLITIAPSNLGSVEWSWGGPCLTDLQTSDQVERYV